MASTAKIPDPAPRSDGRSPAICKPPAHGVKKFLRASRVPRRSSDARIASSSWWLTIDSTKLHLRLQLVEAVEDITVQAPVMPGIIVDVVVCLVSRVIRSAGVKNQVRQFDVQPGAANPCGRRIASAVQLQPAIEIRMRILRNCDVTISGS